MNFLIYILALWLLMPTVPSLAAEIRWLTTPDGERCGVIVECDLATEQGHWALLGAGSGQPPLVRVQDFLRDDSSLDLIFNGGYWNEYQHPVGVCAGPEGIYDMQSHPSGFAMSSRQAYIGPLNPEISLQPLSSRAVRLIEGQLRINQFPLPQKSPCLIAPATFPHRIDAEIGYWIVTFALDEPLRLNRSFTLKVTGTREEPAGSVIEPPDEGSVMLLLPVDELRGRKPQLPSPGDRYILSLRLEPIQGEITLATCGAPILIDRGALRPTGDKRRTWRTAVGIDASGGKFWIIAIARGMDGLPGATIDDTARFLLEQGAYSGINLDGGSSTAFFSRQLGARTRVLFPYSTSVHHVIAYGER